MSLTPSDSLRQLLLLPRLLVLSLSLSFCFSDSGQELRSLLEFKKGIRDDPLNKVLSTWTHNAPDPPRSFYGVVFDDSGSVSAIALDGLGLSGDLKFSTLTPLKNLKNLTLSSNRLSGRLVPTLGSMSSLQYLDLSNNQLYGPIPAKINDLWGLHYLNLSKNNFSGRYPTGIGNLQQLRVLDLHLNNLWGDVAVIFPDLRNVEHVDLSYNKFFGSLSTMGVENVSGLANTVHLLNLSHNVLSGGFFSGDLVGLFRNLRVLDLGDNQLNGVLPSFSGLQTLSVLRLGNNRLYGSIPEELLESVVSLEELDLSGNGFSGKH